jgi:hypothetical protein
MDAEELLGGRLARAHMRRSKLKDRIAWLNDEMHKAMRDLGKTDTEIWDLKGKIQRVSRRAEAA